MQSLEIYQGVIIALASVHFLLSLVVLLYCKSTNKYICLFSIISMVVNAIIIILSSMSLSSTKS